MGGMVLETNMSEILTRVEEQNKLEKQEVRLVQLLIFGLSKTDFDLGQLIRDQECLVVNVVGLAA